LANFEGLINQALASQNAADPAVRQRIYQSSRNALAKMLEKKGDLSDEALRAHFGQLEDSIAAIEATYAPAPPQPAAPEPEKAPSPAPEPEEAEAPAPQVEAAPTPSPEPIVSAPEPVAPPQPTTPPAPVVPPVVDPVQPAAYEPRPLFPPVQTEPRSAEQPAPVVAEVAPASPVADPSPIPPAPSDPPVAPLADPLVELEQRIDPRPQEPSFEPPTEPYLGDVRADIDAPETYAAGYDNQEFDVERDVPPTYKRKNPLLRRIWPIFLAIAVLLVILWILYAVFAIMPEGDGAANNASSTTSNAATGETQQNEDGSFFITLLEPTDLSALVTAGRGSAELVTQQTNQMLRLQSIRQGELTNSNAEPILLELERGVLQQIEGKEVTVELNAKSGLAGPAQFAVECDIAGDSVCGRKRFRVGLQPELIVFALDLKAGIQSDARAFLALNTDITNAADTSGKGDAIDINFVRLRVNEPSS